MGSSGLPAGGIPQCKGHKVLSGRNRPSGSSLRVRSGRGLSCAFRAFEHSGIAAIGSTRIWKGACVVKLRVLAVAAGLFAFASVSAFGQVVINEIHYNPPATAGADAEFIELYNAGASSADLTGWTISNGVVYSFPNGTTIPAGGYLVIAKNPALLQAATGYSGALTWTSGSLDNGGETVSISNATPIIVDTVSYDDVAPWPTAPDGNGKSLELISPTLDNSLAASWAASTGNNGTPGAQNSVFVSAPVIVARTPIPQTMVPTLTSISVTFDRVVTGVAANKVTVNGSPATSFSGSGVGPYNFSGFTAPTPGSVTIAVSGTGILDGSNVPFGGAAWTTAVGTNIVINELNYHPNEVVYPTQDTEFVELYNAGANNVSLSGWQFTNGITYTFPNGTTLNAGAYLVVAVNPTALQAATGYAGALQWTSGNLSNSGEKVGIADASLNQIDLVDYADSGVWPTAADGDGPSLELRNPGYPNEYGAAWGASVPNNGTPGAQNSIYQASLGPIIFGTKHLPIIPAANQAISITATVVDDSPSPTVTLYYRQDQDPTIAYSSVVMLDDGAHGDGAAGDKVYGATVPGLADGQRLDFTIRADDGTNVSAAPAGNNTLTAGQYPTQTYLCKFSSAALPSDFPSYHLITTQRVRNLQTPAIEDEFDGTFVRCDTAGNCENFYNIGEHYRGSSSLNQLPHSYRIDFSDTKALDSELGYKVTKLNLLSQSIHKQYLGMQFFREAFGGQIPTPRSQFVRFNTNPLSQGGVQDYVYHDVEVLDGSFIESQKGDFTPLRFPDRCSTSSAVCNGTPDCPVGQTCVATDDGNLYRGRNDGARLNYKGPDKNSYRTDANGTNGYQKYTNETEDNWVDLIALSFALDPSTTPDASYESSLNPIIDEDEWAKWFAIHMLLVNEEGGIYRDTGDDYFLYFQRSTSPGGYNAKLLPWDMDSTLGGGYDTYDQESIWRTTVVCPQRFIRSNMYAGRFVKAICDMMGNEFLQATMNAKIDALPTAVADAARKTQLKNWVTARRAFVQNEIKTQLTIANLPASPYTNANPVISLNGQLNQCGTRYVKVNGQDADGYSVYLASWNKQITLTPGLNHITVQCLDYTNTEISRVDATVLYDPPDSTPGIRLTMPQRMVNTKTLTLKAELLDSSGNIDWRVWNTLGTVSATRVSNGQAVPLTVTVFERHTAGAGAGGPPTTDSIRLYNGVGSVSLTLNNGASVPAGDLIITVNANSKSASRLVTVVDAAAPGTFQDLSGALSGGNLIWEPADGVIHLTGHVNVPPGQTLTIMPGTLIMVDSGPDGDGNRIDSNTSTINAQGTRTNPIYFFPTNGPPAMVLPQTGSEGSGNGHNNPACWGGFDLIGAGSMTWSYVFMTGTGNGVVSGHPRPTVIRLANNYAFTASDSVLCDSPGKIIYGNGNGVYTIQRCLFARCGIGGEWIGSGYTLTVDDTWMTRIGRAPINASNRLDGDILHIDQPSNARVRRCILTDGGDDIIDHSSAATPIVENSILYDANDKTVSIGGGGSITMTNCLVFEVPGGIRCAGVPAYLTHVTLGPNTNVNGQDTVNSVMQQCIFWPLGSPTCASGQMNYCDTANAANLGCGTGNISANPNYVDSNFSPPGDVFVNFGLQAGSPALTAGPSGNQIGWLGFPNPSGCVNNSDCNDSNPCTTDTCSNGTCSNTPIANCCQGAGDCNDGDPCTDDACSNNVCTHTPANCSDGNACTTDSCSPGVGCQHVAVNCDDNNACTIDSCDSVNGCQHTPVGCPQGQSCNPANGQCQTGPVTVTFQNGFNSYTGTVDTYIDTALGSQATVSPVVVDSSPEEQVLLRFDNIFGSGAGQIPAGSTISSATLTIWSGPNTNDESANAVNFHRLLHTWSDTSVWAAYGASPWNASGGIQNDGVDAVIAQAGTTTITTVATSANIDVTSSLQAWVSSPTSNFGWAILPTGTDGLRLESAESTTSSNSRRPKLSVTYVPPTSTCTTAADCNDNDACTTDACNAGSCSHTPITCNDNNACTTDSCSPASGCVFSPVANGTACSDGNACNGAESCQGGNCTPGTPLNCDDGLACTVDSCNSGSGCVHTDNCPSGSLCNHSTGNCDQPPALPIANGATWKYLKGTAEPAPGDLTSWTHVGYDDSSWSSGASGFGYGDNDDATVLSDMQNTYASVYIRKTFTVANPAVVTQLTLTVDYDDAYIAYINGVEVTRSASMGGTAGTPTAFNALAPTGHEASGGDAGSSPQPPEVTHPSPSVLVAGVNVIAIHGHNQTLASSDFSLIPSLTATVGGCVNASDCNDNNACTTDACNAGSCTHTPITCNDNNSCTTDTCNPASGCVYTPVTDGTACADGNACNGAETCQSGNCSPGTPLNCDDGDPCTTDTCDGQNGCQHAPIPGCCHNAGECNDNSACTTDSCVNNVCQHDPVSCDDGIACTTDSCDSVNGCQHANTCAPTVVAMGSRYLAITPPPGIPSVALRIESPSMSCMPMYVDANGHLSPTPVFRSSAAWGTVHVGDRAIVPSTPYDVRADVRTQSDPVNLSGTATASTWAWGDANNAGGVDVFDIVCVLDGFQSTFGGCSIYGDDLRGNVPDQGVDVFDIVAVLDAFQGTPYPDSTPCGSSLLLAPPAATTPAVITLTPRTRSVAPGGSVVVDMFVSGAPMLRAYQLAADVRGGLTVEAISVDAARADNAFANADARSAFDTSRARMANALTQGWSDCSNRHYLGTMTLRATGDATGTLSIGLKSAGQTILIDADHAAAAFTVTGAKVSVIRTVGISGAGVQPG